jgi:divalent metal cation (Fe/Co/Zn/Cd) transporter
MYLGGDVFRDACRGLMDRSLEEPAHDRMKQAVANVDGVTGLKQLRTRRVGQEVSIEIVVGVDSDLSVSEAFAINQSIKDSVHRYIPHIGSLQIRTEAQDEDASKMADLHARWRESQKRLKSEPAVS